MFTRGSSSPALVLLTLTRTDCVPLGICVLIEEHPIVVLLDLRAFIGKRPSNITTLQLLEAPHTSRLVRFCLSPLLLEYRQQRFAFFWFPLP